MTTMNVQQVSVKVYAKDGASLAQTALIPIFHRWIQQETIADKLLIDVADYRHCNGGPGVMLICGQVQYGLDKGDGQVGMRWAAKRDPLGPADDKLAAAIADALGAAHALETDAMTGGRIAFDTARLLIRVESRIAAENTATDLARMRPALDRVLGRLYGSAALELTQREDGREPLGIEVSASEAPSYADALARLG